MNDSAKTQVLIFMGAYLPGFKGGGPVTSIKNLVDRLSFEIEFRIVAPDRDLFSQTAYPDVPVREWTVLGKEKVLYLPPSLINVLDVLVALRLTPHDVVYLNSFFSPRYTIPVLVLRRLGLVPKRPVVLAVRGEFASAALDLKSRKKQIYLRLAQKTGLLRDVLFHATNLKEEERLRTVLGSGIQTHLAPPLAKLSSADRHKVEPRSGALKVVFLGRIVPMKNLDYALEVLKEVSTPVHFTIYGPAEDELYWEKCQQLIAELPEHVKVEYAGSIAPDEVSETLGQYDLFFLPTRGENFGHVIAEALAAGCPVLISDQTPWQDLEANDCGWALELKHQNSFTQAINKMGSNSNEERDLIRNSAFDYIFNADSSETLQSNRLLFIGHS